MALALLASLRVAAAAPPSPAAQQAAPAHAAVSAPTASSAPASAAPVSRDSGAPAGASSAGPVAVASSVPTAGAASPAAAPASDKSPLSYPSPEGPKEWMHGEDINWGRQITTTVIWLVLMCGTIFLITRFLYGRAGLGGLRFGARRSIQILDRQMLGSQKALLTVHVPGKVLLLGMTDHTITTLAELAPEDFEGVQGAAPTAAVAPRSNERAASPEASPDNLVDLASLFGRRGVQPSKGDDPE